MKFNSQVKIADDPESIIQGINLPFSNIEIDSYLLYKLFKIYWPQFINSQKNEVDIIVSDYDVDKFVLGAYLHISNQPGIFEKVSRLPNDAFKIKKSDLSDIPSLFNRIEDVINNNKGIKISLVRIFKKRAIDLINTYYENLDKHNFTQNIKSLVELIYKITKNDLVIFHPEPLIFRFLRKITEIFELNVSRILDLLIDYISIYNVAILSENDYLPFTIHLYQNEKKQIGFRFLQNIKHRNEISLSQIKDKINCDSVLSFNELDLSKFLLNLIEYDLPLSKGEFTLIFQKILYGIRSIEKEWKIYPKPIFYKPIYRWLLRLIGFNLNLRKLSHWNISEFFINLFLSRTGLNSSLVIIITDSIESTNFSDSISYLINVIIKNGKISRILSINKEKLSLKSIDNLKSFKFSLSSHSIPANLIIKIDSFLIKELLNKCLIDFHQISPIKLYSILKKFKKSKYFEIFPKYPEYQLFKQKRFGSFLKMMFAISIDKHEF